MKLVSSVQEGTKKMQIKEKVALLKKLGMNKLASRVEEKSHGREAIKKALETFNYLTQRDLDFFREDIRKNGKDIKIEKIQDYGTLPPSDVINKLEETQKLGIFDEFVILSIVKVKDPILFGKVEGFKDLYFFIAQWGDDVTFEEILGD